MLNNFSKWKIHLIIIFLITALSIAAVVIRGSEAMKGILWGSDDFFCSIGVNNDCKINVSDLPINFGIYDPDSQFDNSNKIAIEHIFVNWIAYQPQELKNEIKKINNQSRWPLVTIEPYPNSKQNLFEAIQQGVYDNNIQQICKILASSSTPVFIRFAHEMENVTGRYPWATNDSQDYIAAYRHFVNKCRQSSNKFYFVWSPAGNKNLSRYWPGRKYADYIGLSVYAFDQYDINHFGHDLSFDEIFDPKYQRVKNYNRPIIIAELGVNGRSRQRAWLEQMYKSIRKYPLLKSVVYFDAKDSPLAWGNKYIVPNWQISPTIFP